MYIRSVTSVFTYMKYKLKRIMLDSCCLIISFHYTPGSMEYVQYCIIIRYILILCGYTLVDINMLFIHSSRHSSILAIIIMFVCLSLTY